MCLSPGPENPKVKLGKYSLQWHHHICAEYPYSFEGLKQAHHEEEEEEEEDEEEGKMRSNSRLAHRYLCSKELPMHASDDCMLPLPSLEEFAHILVSCKKDKDRNCALSLHAYLCVCGLEAHGFLGNYLVPMLVEVGSIAYAQHAFARLPYTSECAWNSLLIGYLKNGELEQAYILYQKMQQEDSVHLSNITSVSLLKACAKFKDLVKGSYVHAHVVAMNLECDLFVGSALVDMYAKCGLLIKAHEVFEKILDRDAVAWTALLAGYVEHGQSHEALQVFEQMQLEGVFPDAVTFVSNLKACASIGAIQKGREVHAKAACTWLLEKDIFLGSTLVDMYAKFGLLALAHQVFDKLLIRDVVSWTALITGYVENGQSEEALKCCEQMQTEGVPADAVTFVCSLKAWGMTGSIHKVREIHAKMATTGLLGSDIVIANTLVDMYGKCSSLSDAKQVFERLSKQDVVSWTTLIAAHVKHSLNEEALECLEHMQLEGVLPNTTTFVCSLKACSSIKASDKAQAIHAEVEIRGLFFHDHVGTALVDVYAKCGLLASAQQVFNMLRGRDVVSWTAVISGYAEHDCGERAIKCFNEMLCEGITPSAVTFLYILKACASIGPLVEMHAEIERRSLLNRDRRIGTTLVDMYAKCGSIAKAQEVFNNLQVFDVVSWNALMAAYVDDGCSEEALACYECMRGEGFFPDSVTILCSLKACGNIGAGNIGTEIHCEAERRGLLERDFAVGTSLVGMYSKCGLFTKAWEVLEKLPVRSVTSWNALFSGYAEHGRGEEATMCLEHMEVDGVQPNFDTFLCSLKACGNTNGGRNFVGDVEWRGFAGEVLVKDHSLHKNIYPGLFDVAHKVFDKLPTQDVSAWSALITGYFMHGCCEEGLECFQQMQTKGLTPDVVTLACTLKACSSIGALEKGREIHAEIERKGLFETDIAIGNTLVHMYARCGCLAEAHQVFDNLSARDVVSWTALISGYAERELSAGALKCLAQMQLEGVTPDAVTFISSIKACGSIGNTIRGEELHVEVERAGLLKQDPIVGTALVAMYSQHGMLGKSREVLERLPVRGIFAWTVLMAGYVEWGLSKEALGCFEHMQLDGFAPDIVTFVCVLKACAKEGDLDKGREIHSLIEAMGISKCDRVLVTTLGDMYAKCGSLDAARQVFDRLCVHDVVSYTALMAGYAEQGHAKEALDCFEQMQVEGFVPNSLTLTFGLRICGSIGARSSGQEFHAEVQRRGLLEVDCVAKALVDMYAKLGCFEMAKNLFYELPFRDHVLWSSLIGGLAEHGHGEEALACLDQMLLEGGCFDGSLSVCSLKACSNIGSREKGQQIHSEIERVGLLKEDLLVGSTLVDMYVKCGTLVTAQEVFDKLPSRDVVSWTALIVGYAHYGYGGKALECFEQMQLEGLTPDPVAFLCVLKACSSIGAIDKGRDIHLEIERKGFLGEDLAIGNTLISMYAKNGLLSLARQVFDDLPVRDTVSWNSIIAGYGQLGDSHSAFANLKKMLVEGIKPDPGTFKIIVGVCCRAGLFDETHMYLEAMGDDYGITLSLEHLIGIVDLLCRVGHVEKALTMVKKMPLSSNLVLWNRVLEACRHCGLLELGKQAFEHTVLMEKTQVDANWHLTSMWAPPARQHTRNEVTLGQFW